LCDFLREEIERQVNTNIQWGMSRGKGRERKEKDPNVHFSLTTTAVNELIQTVEWDP
jgi:hypothetical protein